MHQPDTEQARQETIGFLPELSDLYRSIERRKAEMLIYLDGLTDEARSKSPTPSEWSPLQVMEHVVVVEEWVAAPPPNGNVSMRGYLFMIFGVGIMRTRLRMPTLSMAEPRGALDYTAIKRRWDRARNMIAPKLAAVTRKTRALPIALHPVAGPLNAQQVLELLDVHLAYHCRNLPRLTQHIGNLG